jgi:Protein of unknown function (DUF3313)
MLKGSQIASASTNLAIAAGLALMALLSGCAATVQSQPSLIGKAMGEQAPVPAPTGFLGSDYSLLQPGKEGQALLIYINPTVTWSNYTKVMIEPVEFWDSADSSVSPADQQMLTDYFYTKLKEDLQKEFTIVDQPGPGVMVLRVALINAESATPGLRSISVVIPQARILNGIQSLATGSYAFVGGAEAVVKVTDGQTGQLLAASADKRQGGMAISQAAQWKWGDAEAVEDYWAQKIAERAHQLQTTGSITSGS